MSLEITLVIEPFRNKTARKTKKNCSIRRNWTAWYNELLTRNNYYKYLVAIKQEKMKDQIRKLYFRTIKYIATKFYSKIL